MKKVYNAPYMKVVEVKNDIIATSVNDEVGNGSILAPGRHGMWEEDFSEEDVY